MNALALTLFLLAPSAPPATRIAVLLDDPSPGEPARAQIETLLQTSGYEVVAPDVSEKMRKVVAPKALLESRLPEGLSVFEADAIVAGAASYGAPADMEGVQRISVTLTARLIDLGTGRTTATLQTAGVGLGVDAPASTQRGAKQAAEKLFQTPTFAEALKNVGQEAGMVTLIVQNVPSREALLALRRGLERALAGAPVKEIYFAKGLGKLALGGSSKKSMVGPDIADVISETKSLAITVEEVANTRIVATYNPARTVQIHALVTEPKVPRGSKPSADELGRYVANKVATFEYARASYQAGRLSRERACERARAIGADVVIESEVLGSDKSAALAIRVIDAKTGKPILREQKLIEGGTARLETAEGLLATIQGQLPERLGGGSEPAAGKTPGLESAAKDEGAKP